MGWLFAICGGLMLGGATLWLIRKHEQITLHKQADGKSAALAALASVSLVLGRRRVDRRHSRQGFKN